MSAFGSSIEENSERMCVILGLETVIVNFVN